MLSCFNHFQLFATLWTVAYQTTLSMGLSRQEYCSRLSRCPPGNLPNPRIEPASPASPELQVDSLFTEPPAKPNVCVSFPVVSNSL